ncbi:MAG TPA: carbohydrate ABC transporter permease [Chloroflexota bacterium]|nr:carbohydrate ABC transporter permease [Chloroflexota bacterium]
MTIKLNRSAPSIIAYIVLVFLGIFFILPFIWVLVSSLNTSATFSVTWPAHPSLENFQIVISTGLVAQPFKNSLILAGSTMLLTILLSGLAAYPLSRYHFRFKSALMYGILFVSALPILAFITPLYALYVALDPIVHMIDTFHGVILFLVASALPFNIWLMKNYLDSVSIELEEAAWVDGASTLTALFRVVLPLSAPGIAVVGVLSFTGAWSNFFIPFIIFQNPDNLPASVNIFSFFGAYGSVNYGQLTAYAMLYALPVMVLYITVSRFFVKGVNLGGVKG